MQISRIEIDRQNELKTLKERLETINRVSLETMQQNFANQLDSKKIEILQLKDILEIKNQEI